MKHEDQILRRYVEKSRLEEWYRTVVDGAEKACQIDTDRETMNGARANEESLAETNGNGQALNGKSL